MKEVIFIWRLAKLREPVAEGDESHEVTWIEQLFEQYVRFAKLRAKWSHRDEEGEQLFSTIHFRFFVVL